MARGLGEAAEQFIRNARKDDGIEPGSLPTIAATCGLIHDIGNPPFGHAGESAISSWFANQSGDDIQAGVFDAFPGVTPKQKIATQYAQDFLKFEGNAQTQRLLSSLQILADRFGLNMTCGTLSASLKYVVASNEIDTARAEAKKHGFFASENELIGKIKDEVGTGNARNPLASLVEAADDICYATVDLEDGIKKGCLDWSVLQKRVEGSCRGRASRRDSQVCLRQDRSGWSLGPGS